MGRQKEDKKINKLEKKQQKKKGKITVNDQKSSKNFLMEDKEKNSGKLESQLVDQEASGNKEEQEAPLTTAFLEELEKAKNGKEDIEVPVGKSKKKKKKGKIIAITLILLLLISGGTVATLYYLKSTSVIAEGAKPRNPLTGEVVEEPLPARPIIVSNDNAEGARPQSGISKADIVYEFPAEGNIPRLQPIFYSEFPERVAPVRSVRNYFVDLAREFKAIHVGFGVSPQANDYLKTGVIPYVNPNTYQYGEDDDMFWRDDARPDGVHNVYTNLQEIYDMNKTPDWQSQQILRTYPRYEDDLTEEEKTEETTLLESYPVATNITMSYISEDIEYVYDPETELYTRYVDGDMAVDFEDDTPITTSNIIVQYVSIGMLDAKRLDIDMTEGGNCVIFTKGKAFVGNWSRDDLDSPTIFYTIKTTEEGEEYKEEIKLSIGKTWVQVIGKNNDDLEYK